MPRLPSTLVRLARSIHPLLPLLLRPCRDLPSALNELRWLREHAIANRHVTLTSSGQIRTSWPRYLHSMCLERARGKPLQYILGTQPFGELEILCKRGVLIPRPETETLTTHLATLLLSSSPSPSPSSTPPPTPLRILDLCTGTGCISLHLYALLHTHIPTLDLYLLGIDISPLATSLANKNLTHAINRRKLPPEARTQISFQQGDIFAPPPTTTTPKEQSQEGEGARHPLHQNWDILISNPPYISPTSYTKTTSRSVRNHEPKSALVPPPTISPLHNTETAPSETGGDAFYPRILAIAAQVSAKVLVVEVADMEQAVRVAGMVLGQGRGRDHAGGGGFGWEGCEIWRDWPVTAAEGGGGGEEEVVEVRGEENVRVKGEGNGRAVLAWRGEDGGRMVGKE